MFLDRLEAPDLASAVMSSNAERFSREERLVRILAAAVATDPRTVRKYLKGERVHPPLKLALSQALPAARELVK